MPTVVVILPTSTYRAADFIRAAESLGIDLIVASEEPPPLDTGGRYVQVDCRSPGSSATRIATLGETVPIDGVVAADDQGVMIAAEASTLLGLPGNDSQAAAATRDKLLMRSRLTAAEVDQPRYAGVGPDDDLDAAATLVGFPLVVKPVDRSASQGVIRVDQPGDLHHTTERIRAIVGERATLLLEEYVAGPEIAIEGMLSHGELNVLAVFDKPDTSSGPYFPETLFVTPSRLSPATLAEAERMAAMAARGLGLMSGPIHVELRGSGERFRIIEIAARSIGGLCSRSLNFGLMGTTLESLILRNAIGLGRTHLRREQVASGVLMIPIPRSGVLRQVVGEREARAIPAITGMDLTIVAGNQVLAPPEGDRYLGFVYARADTPEEVEAALRKAMATLEVQLEG